MTGRLRELARRFGGREQSDEQPVNNASGPAAGGREGREQLFLASINGIAGEKAIVHAFIPPARERVNNSGGREQPLNAAVNNTADACRRCREPMGWPGPAGVIFLDGTAECLRCYEGENARLLAAARRAVAGVAATGDGGALVERAAEGEL